MNKTKTQVDIMTELDRGKGNWWDGDGSGEDRCYLQLSGWY
jgi:hypothetical protein